MIEVRQTATFREWFERLRDQRAQSRIAKRIANVQLSGGDKNSQARDISKAKALADELEDL